VKLVRHGLNVGHLPPDNINGVEFMAKSRATTEVRYQRLFLLLKAMFGEIISRYSGCVF